MPEALTLYGCPNTRSLRAAWALEEAGVAYDYCLVDLFRGDGRKPPLIELNPGGKVPVLLTPDGAISESGAILLWIAERFPAAGLLPGGGEPRLRTQSQQWCFFVVSELEQPLWTLAKHRFALPPEQRLPAIEGTARWEFERATRQLARHLEGRTVLAGGRFGVADILACHTLAWARSARVALGSPILEEYLDRHWTRPAAERARAREGRLPRSHA